MRVLPIRMNMSPIPPMSPMPFERSVRTWSGVAVTPSSQSSRISTHSSSHVTFSSGSSMMSAP